MKKILLAAVAVVALSSSAHAQLASLCFVNDPLLGITPCNSLGFQILQYARQALQLEQEVITAENEVIAALTLPRALFQDATIAINNVTNLARQADLLANNTGGFIQNLSAPYYPLPNNGMQQLILHQNAVANATSTLGQVINTENARMAAAAATLASLSSEALANAGRHQTLQDQAQIQAAHAQQLQSLEAIKMAEAQAQQASQLADHDRRAMAAAWADKMATAYTPLQVNAAPGH